VTFNNIVLKCKPVINTIVHLSSLLNVRNAAWVKKNVKSQGHPEAKWDGWNYDMKWRSNAQNVLILHNVANPFCTKRYRKYTVQKCLIVYGFLVKCVCINKYVSDATPTY
jgi:hypothetical protein